MNDFNHLIEINKEKRELVIYRIEKDGNKTLYTSVDLPGPIDTDKGLEQFGEFAKILGENILLDSPTIREIYNL